MDKSAKIKVILAVVVLLVALGLVAWYLSGGGGAPTLPAGTHPPPGRVP